MVVVDLDIFGSTTMVVSTPNNAHYDDNSLRSHAGGTRLHTYWTYDILPQQRNRDWSTKHNNRYVGGHSSRIVQCTKGIWRHNPYTAHSYWVPFVQDILFLTPIPVFNGSVTKLYRVRLNILVRYRSLLLTLVGSIRRYWDQDTHHKTVSAAYCPGGGAFGHISSVFIAHVGFVLAVVVRTTFIYSEVS
jgi:hypothetical protein